MTLNSYKDILFDLDGTLVDSARGILDSIRYGFAQTDIDVSQLNFNLLLGPPLAEGLRQFLPDVFQDEKYLHHVVKLIRTHYAEHGAHQGELYPGIENLLKNLKVQDRRLFVATGKPEVFAEKILARLNVMQYFDYVAGNVMEGVPLTKSDVIAKVLTKFAMRANSVMIGDRYHDIEGAQHHKMDSIAVLYGYGTEAEFLTYQPTHIARDVKKLADLLGSSEQKF